jgi:toxin ParE1/3/4
VRLRYHEAAEEELLDEIGYLEAQAPGLGRRFLEEILRIEQSILEFPAAGIEVQQRIRKRVLRTFRYSIFYSEEEAGPLVLAVAHHLRRPGYWTGRVGG